MFSYFTASRNKRKWHLVLLQQENKAHWHTGINPKFQTGTTQRANDLSDRQFLALHVTSQLCPYRKPLLNMSHTVYILHSTPFINHIFLTFLPHLML